MLHHYNIQIRRVDSRSLLLAFLLLLFAACSTPAILQKQAPPDVHYRLQNQQVEQARTMAAQGDYLAAAKAFWNFSTDIQAPRKQSYQITAVEYLIKANLIEQAQQQLSLIQPVSSDTVSPVRIVLAQAEIQIASQQSKSALTALQNIDPINLSPVLQKRHLELHALAHETLGEYQQSADKRLQLDVLLRDTNRQLYNQKMLWNDLLHMSPTQLSQHTANRSADSQAWYALALLAKTVSVNNYPKALTEWQKRYPQHPIRHHILNQLNRPFNPNQNDNAISRANTSAGAHIALLLPQTGQLHHTSQAISDAFIAAWYEDAPQLPPVQIYDVSNPADVVNQYKTAVDNGAQLVIGPLLKSSLTALTQTYSHFPVPTIFLNQIDGSSAHSNLFQFSLSPEEEAAQVAQQALLDGRHMATALAPENQWGQRLLQAFRQSWEANGGTFLGQAYYTEQDFNTGVRQVLENHPQTDMLFIAASPEDARRLVPQVRYVLSSEHLIRMGKINLPIYATSHVYSGSPSSALDRDLNGVKFVDMPWILNTTDRYQNLKQQQQQYADTGNKRLFAFGLDAYQIARYLYQPDNNPLQLQINGATGQLSLDSQGVIHRQLSSAGFNQGQVKVLNP